MCKHCQESNLHLHIFQVDQDSPGCSLTVWKIIWIYLTKIAFNRTKAVHDRLGKNTFSNQRDIMQGCCISTRIKKFESIIGVIRCCWIHRQITELTEDLISLIHSMLATLTTDMNWISMFWMKTGPGDRRTSRRKLWFDISM